MPTNLANFMSSSASISLKPEEKREQGLITRDQLFFSSAESGLTLARRTGVRPQEGLLQIRG
jgi:hypothetical protein